MEHAGIEEARRTLGEIVDRARFTGDPTIITRQGKPAAAVVNLEWYAEARTQAAGAEDPPSEHPD